MQKACIITKHHQARSLPSGLLFIVSGESIVLPEHPSWTAYLQLLRMRLKKRLSRRQKRSLAPVTAATAVLQLANRTAALRSRIFAMIRRASLSCSTREIQVRRAALMVAFLRLKTDRLASSSALASIRLESFRHNMIRGQESAAPDQTWPSLGGLYEISSSKENDLSRA